MLLLTFFGVSMANRSKKVVISARITPYLKAAIDMAAAAQNEKIVTMMEALLEQGLNDDTMASLRKMINPNVLAMLQLTGGSPIWIPDESITAIRTERAIAGKVLTYDGILAIRWQLPSGTEIDTGFRSDDRRELAKWVEEDSK